MIFAREVSDPLTSLVKKVDAATGDNQKANMGSFVVFLGDAEGREKKLKELVEKEKIEWTILTMDTSNAGPAAYKIDKDADVTIVLYVKSKVKANYAFKKGEMKDKDVEKIVKDIPSILP